ncbi:hypothetical protein BUQ74_08840 [Leptospira weilii serovar Heyan]|nr:hypothetical protein BUQ74_08840 [Leptospira weilii serovar Heyan]
MLSSGSVVPEFPPRLDGGGEAAGKLGRLFSIRKSYFLQVKNRILVGTLAFYCMHVKFYPLKSNP